MVAMPPMSLQSSKIRTKLPPTVSLVDEDSEAEAVLGANKPAEHVVSVAVAIKKFLKRADQMVWRIAPPQNENGPAQCAGNQSTCRLVDVQVVLECN